MLTVRCLHITTMLSISAQLNDEDFLGTAEDLANFVTTKFVELGFGAEHTTTERLVRFYTYQGLISRPERAIDDRRKANFGQIQVRQLLLSRLLSERGWDLNRIKNLFSENQSIRQLNRLIDDLATPTEAEKLFFKTRSDNSPSLKNSVYRSISAKHKVFSDYSPSFEKSPDFQPSRNRKISSVIAQEIRRLSESDSPADALKMIIKKELFRDDISDDLKDLYRQLMAFNPTSRGDEPKRERWTRLRLATWCEALIHVDSKGYQSSEEIEEIVIKFRKALLSGHNH